MSREEKALYKEKHDKELLRLDRELGKLWKAMLDTYVEEPVDPPIRNGWTRTLVLREDVRKDVKHAKYIEEALKVSNVVQFSHRKDFKIRNYRTYKWVDREIKPLSISDKTYESLSDRAKVYFRKVYHVNSWCSYYSWDCEIPTYMLKIKVDKNYIRSKRIYDTKLESQYNRLHKEMERRADWTRLDKLYGYSHPRDYYNEEYYQVRKLPLDSLIKEEANNE